LRKIKTYNSLFKLCSLLVIASFSGMKCLAVEKLTGCINNVTPADLIASPKKWLNKDVCFEGKFSSLSNLALNYPPALRKSDEYISLIIFRPKTTIPLGELKMNMKIADIRKDSSTANLQKGDLIRVRGKVFSAALGEPWIDITQLSVKANKKKKPKKTS